MYEPTCIGKVFVHSIKFRAFSRQTLSVLSDPKAVRMSGRSDAICIEIPINEAYIRIPWGVSRFAQFDGGAGCRVFGIDGRAVQPTTDARMEVKRLCSYSPFDAAEEGINYRAG
jgi:hypothetical protein